MVEVILQRLRALLRECVVHTQQGVRVGVAGVQRVRAVAREVDVALDVHLIVAGIRGALEVVAELEGVRALDLAQGVHDLPDQEALVEGPEDACIGETAGARDRAETDGRDQAGSVGVGIEQRDVNTG